MKNICYQVGIDIGSTTTKLVVLNPDTAQIGYSSYRRHGARQAQSLLDCAAQLREQFPDAQFRIALTGSGAKTLADGLGLPYVQEVVANSVAIRKRYHHVHTAIELGGQDAKVLFFRRDEGSGRLETADMRMNGSCAGGTGAFLDEVAAILRIPVEELNQTAERGERVYDISGRCGVYAKTDIQPLLNQGVSKENLALSAFHAVAKQTIGGLAQGLTIRGPVLFEGGPMTFNPVLIRVFAERLSLTPEEILVPKHPETMVAYGAALSLEELFAERTDRLEADQLQARLDELLRTSTEQDRGPSGASPWFFASEEERADFQKRHALPARAAQPVSGRTIRSIWASIRAVRPRSLY